LDRGIIREKFKIFKENVEIGYVTSGGYSPTLKKTIGLGIIKKQYKEIGTKLEIQVRNKKLKGIVVSTPFFRNI
jgi:aminomethyltransferase